MTTHERIQQTLVIARKELRGYFETPIAYIVVVLFATIAGFLFFRNAFLSGEASLAVMIDFIPWLLMFVVPAFTMGVFATERESGTYETLATRPLTEWEILIGKYSAILAFLAGMLLLVMLPIAIVFSFFGALDWGVFVTQYLGSVFLSGLFAAIGTYLSSLFSRQVTALLASITANFILVVVGLDLVAQVVPLTLAHLMDSMSALSHFQSMARGVIDVRDLWYFLSVIVAFLLLAQYRLLATRFAPKHTVRARWRVGTALVVATVLITNVLGSAIPGRLDLTRGGLYTLSPATKQMVANLPDVVHITLYASGGLPAVLQPVLRDVRDILRDYARYGKGNVVFSVKDPDSAPEIATEAEQGGVQPVQFNVMGQGELSVKKGYLGVSIAYNGKNHALPFVDKTNDLEYQMTSNIAELTATNKKRIAFLTGHGESSREATMQALSGELEKLYEVSDFALSSTTASVATGTDLLIIADPSKPFGEHERTVLKTYLDNGGGVLALMAGVAVDERTLDATARPKGINDLFASYGVTVDDALVYDLRSSQIVSLSAGGGRSYALQYPFWVRAGMVPGSPITNGLESALVPWGSMVSVDENALSAVHATMTPLIVTSPYAGVMRDQFTLMPNQPLPKTNLGQRLLAVSVSGTSQTSPRLVLVGNTTLASDQVITQESGNAAFLLGAISWLAQDTSLASIKVKSGVRPTLTIGSQITQSLIQYGTVAFSVLLPLLFGLSVYMRRRAIQKYTYSSRPLNM